MEQKVIISIQARQSYPGCEPERMELVTEGTLEDRGESGVVLSYRESELTGLEGTQTTIQVRPGQVTLLREGAVNSQMVFEEGKRHLSAYQTPYGALEIGLWTRRVRSSLDGRGGDVSIYYALEIEHGEAGKNQFRIHVRPAAPDQPT